MRGVIADDERLMREQLRARLAEVWPELQIVGEAKNGLEAVELSAQHHPDVVFLDIRMPGLSGVDAARRIAQLPAAGRRRRRRGACAEIVFITAYDQYAIEAFEQGVADYVLKPAERERLRRHRGAHPPAPGRAARADGRAARARPCSSCCTSSPRSSTRWHAAGAEMDPGHRRPEIQMIPVEEVLFFISDEKYTRVQTASLEALIRKPIKELVDELDPELFWQIHRSTLVNTRAIAGVTRDLRGRQIVAVRATPRSSK